ncbi:MAG: hypothetical protein ACLS43_09490 [Evtepia gabavorous]
MAIDSDEAAVAAKAWASTWTGWSPPGPRPLRVLTKGGGMLIQPTHHHAPGGCLPLAKRGQDPRLTERFELFICRSEMGNASPAQRPLTRSSGSRSGGARASGDERPA